MPPFSTPSRRLPLASVQLWTWALATLSLALCLAITLLYYSQEDTLYRSQQWLRDFREARIDLAKGVLNFTLGEDPQSPFQWETGIAYLEQAVAVLGAAETLPSPVTTEPLNTGFRTKTMAFRAQLEAYSHAEPAARREQQLPLLLAFHELENQAQRLDSASQANLNNLATRLHTRFVTTLFISGGLLALMCLGVHQVGRKQQQTEAALRQSEECLRTLGDNLPGGALYQLLMPTDGRNRYTYFSAGFERIFGVSVEGVLADPTDFWNLILAEDRPRIKAEEERCARAMTVFDLEFRQHTVDGEVKWIHSRSTPRRLEDGSIIWNGVVADITARKQGDESLRLSEARYREVVENSNSVILRWRHDGTLTFFNSFAQRFFGYTAGEAIGKHVGMLVPNTETTGRSLDTLIQDIVNHPERHVNVVNENVCHDGRRVWLAWTNKPVFDATGRVVEILAIGSDITELKVREREVERLNRLYATLSQINQAVVRVQSRLELFQQICEVTAKYSGFTLVWIGWRDPHIQRMQRVARAGDDSGFLDEIEAYDSGQPLGHGPIETCLLEGHSVICNDFLNEPQAQPWHAAALLHGLQSMAVFPLRSQGEVCGTFAVYDRDRNAFQDKELALLEEAAMDVNYAIEHLDHERLRSRAEDELRASEEKYRNLFVNMAEEVHYWQLVQQADGHIKTWRLVDANPPALKSWQRQNLEEIRGRTADEIFGPGATEHYRAIVEKITTEGRPHSFEDYFPHLQKYFRFTSVPFGDYFITTGADITSSKLAEETLRKSEARRALALDAAHAGTWEWDLKSGQNTWSEELWTLYGLEPHSCEPSFEAWVNTLHPEDRERTQRQLGELVQQEAELTLEWRVKNTGASSRWLMSRGRPLRDESGRVTRYLGVVIDITERKRAEEAARQSEQRLNFALQASQTGAWSLNVQDRTTTRTPIHAQIFGYLNTETDWSLEKFFEHVLPEDRVNVQQCIQAGIAAKSGWSFEVRIRRTDDQVRWVFIAGGFEGEGGSPQVYGIIQDITERKQSEVALRRSEEKFRLVYDSNMLGVAFWTADGQLTGANQAFCNLIGYSPEDILARRVRWIDITPADMLPRDLESIAEVNATGTCRPYEKAFLHRAGHLVSVIVVGGMLGGVRDEGVMLAIDITDHKRLEQEHAALEAQMRQQQKLESIGTLASGVAHEINNPINGILNYAQLIQDRLPNDSPLTEFTGEIMHETQRVATIVRNLLTFARNEKQSHSPAYMADIVEAVLSLVRTVIRHDQITLAVNVPPDLPPLKCRSQQIQQVIMNLVTNARDALNERYPGHDPNKVLNLEARLLQKAGRRWIRITVEDHGTGIPQEVRGRIFDPFFTTKGRNQGTGLGLSISHGIVKEHHGEWTVESEPGQFTRMLIELPVDNGWEL